MLTELRKRFQLVFPALLERVSKQEFVKKVEGRLKNQPHLGEYSLTLFTLNKEGKIVGFTTQSTEKELNETTQILLETLKEQN